ncbi:MAG TPA: hypothetical protein VI365_00150 [Trebonia sp.]
MDNITASAAAWGPNRLDVFGVGGDKALYHKAWEGDVWEAAWDNLGGQFIVPGPIEPVPPPGRAVIVGDVATFDSGPLTSSLPLQGSAHVVFDEKGDFTFTCHAHDSGFDNIDYTVAAVILTQSGIAFTFQHLGGTEGTTAGLPFGTPRRDDPFTTGGTNAEVANEWAGMPGALMSSSINGSDALVGGIEGEFGTLLNTLLQELGKAAAAAIVALV